MTNKTIKFKDLPLGGRFKSMNLMGMSFLKISDELAYTGSYSISFIPDSEVELITKCNNCINYLDGYCSKIGVTLGEPIQSYGLRLDTETFSCSLFEQEDRG